MSARLADADLRRIVRGAGASLGGATFGRGLTLVTQILLARWLGLEAYGIYTLGIAAARLGEAVASLGLGPAGTRFVANHHRDVDGRHLLGIVTVAVALPLVVGATLSVALRAAASSIAGIVVEGHVLAETLTGFAWAIPFMAAGGVVAQLLLGFQSTGATVFVRNVVQPLSHLVLLVAVAGPRAGMRGFVTAWGVSWALALGVALILFVRRIPGPSGLDLGEAGALVRYAGPLFLSSLVTWLLGWIDIILIGVLASTAEVGLYRAASQAPRLIGMLVNATSSIYAPMVADYVKTRGRDELAALLRTVTRWLTYAALPAFALLVVGASDLLRLFGDEYVAAGTAIAIVVACGQLVNCIAGAARPTLTMSGHQSKEMWNQALTVPLVVALNLWLIPTMGGLGAAIAFAVTLLAVNAVRLIEVRSLVGRSALSAGQLRALLPGLMAAVVSGLGLALLPWPASLAAAAAGSAVVTVAFVRFGPVFAEDKALLGRLRSPPVGGAGGLG